MLSREDPNEPWPLAAMGLTKAAHAWSTASENLACPLFATCHGNHRAEGEKLSKRPVTFDYYLLQDSGQTLQPALV